MFHRQFAHLDHQLKKNWFNGKTKYDVKPKILNGEEIFLEFEKLKNDHGKKVKKETQEKGNKSYGKKKEGKKRKRKGVNSLPSW